ncbi:MAG TPA: flagellar hook protein FlgE [Myxococcota bacterium]|nr:flagellar hook protein FlgE [Myxococcota bacterium]
MPLSSALFASVSGLDAMGTAISVVGDNIANVNTTGFKARRPEFADVLGQSIASVQGFSQIGAGTKISGVTPNFTQGTFETTNRPTDLAIEGRGFFILDSPQGRFYSRAGLFNFDRDGYLTNPEGQRVQGYTIDPLTQISTGTLADINVGNPLAPPSTTTTMDLSVNLDSNAPVIAGGFDTADPNNTSNFRSVVTIYDSLGNGHPATIFFTKTGTNAWAWNATLPVADTTTAPANATDTLVVQGSGTLTFDAQGALQAMTGSPVNYQVTGGAAANQAVVTNFGPVAGVGTGDPTTQFGTSSTTNSFSQDGYAAGSLQSIVIGRDGFITGQFTNGESLNLAQVALANFPNVQGLVAVGGNNLIASRFSGQPLVGEPQSGSFGAIRSSNLEQSNVDLASEFVRLIINQRAFQANTRTISTTNELLGNLIQLGQ